MKEWSVRERERKELERERERRDEDWTLSIRSICDFNHSQSIYMVDNPITDSLSLTLCSKFVEWSGHTLSHQNFSTTVPQVVNTSDLELFLKHSFQEREREKRETSSERTKPGECSEPKTFGVCIFQRDESVKKKRKE